MTHDELKVIAERANSAMPGPWQWDQGDKHMMILEQDWNRMGKRPSEAGEAMICGATKCEACVARGAHCFCPRKEDAEFIAHAREDIPDLLAEVGRLQDCVRFHQDAEKAANALIENLRDFLDKVEAHIKRGAVIQECKNILDEARAEMGVAGMGFKPAPQSDPNNPPKEGKE